MDGLTLGILATSRKENEHRLPVHPHHLDRIDADLLGRITLERGYGEHFGVGDDALFTFVSTLQPREQILAECDVVLLPKPEVADVAEMRAGQVLWGWPHCVQNTELTQVSIDRRLTVIAWEAMNHWNSDGSFGLHVFHKNNEIAGYASVLHALQLVGSSGAYGRQLRAAVLSFGSTGRGAVTGLNALGIYDVTVLTQRDVPAVAAPIPSMRLGQFERRTDDPSRTEVLTRAGQVRMAEFLAGYDVVVNCVLQDTDAPLMFVDATELLLVPPGTVVVDVSCDEGMGFEWARPTTFTDPMFTVGDGVRYYAVDHSPSYLWNSATWEISEALLPHLRTVLGGPERWEAEETIRRAIEIRDGVVANPKILSFQRRAADYPHARLAGATTT